MTRPLSAVLDAFERGAASLPDIEKITALDHDVVMAAVDHLIRTGRLEARALTPGCASGGCAGCELAASDSDSGCACAPNAGRRGGGLVALTLHRPG